MREIALRVSNYSLFIILACALSAMQSSLWFHIFGYSPAPYLWLLIICYWTLYRSFTEAVIITYLATYFVVSMSSVPLSTGFAINTSVFACIFLLRDRVLWAGINSFLLACGIAAAILPIFVFIWSFVLDPRPSHEFQFFEWILRTPLTAVLAFPFYYLFTWIDKITHKEAPKDSESGFI